MPDAQPRDFDPTRHLTRVQGGNQYLEVKWRVVWLRQEHPEAVIDTELVEFNEQEVVVRADVRITRMFDGRPQQVSASGLALEPRVKPNRTGGALENAETSALGRALGHLGYSEDMLAYERSDQRIGEQPAPASRTDSRPRRQQIPPPEAPPQQPPQDPVLDLCKRIKKTSSVQAMRSLRAEIDANPEYDEQVVKDTFNDRWEELRGAAQGLPG